MNWAVKLIVIAAFAETALAGVAALAWVAHVAGGLDLAHLHRPIPPLLWMSPLCLAGAGLIFWATTSVKRPAAFRQEPRLSEQRPADRRNRLGTDPENLFVYGFVVGCQPDREMFARLVITGLACG